VFRKERSRRIKEQARLSGMVTLLEDGVRKIFDGITSSKRSPRSPIARHHILSPAKAAGENPVC